MKLIMSILLLLGVLSLGGYIALQSKIPSQMQSVEQTSRQQEMGSGSDEQTVAVDYQASFAIFTNGTRRLFTDPKYHNQSEEVFLQADNLNILHVKKRTVTWDDFFKTLPMQLTKDCLITGTQQTFCTGTNGTLKFYRNGREDKDALEKQIADGDQLLVSFGNEDENKLQQQLQQVPLID